MDGKTLKRASDVCFLLAIVLLVVGLTADVPAVLVAAAVFLVAAIALTSAKRRGDKARRQT